MNWLQRHRAARVERERAAQERTEIARVLSEHVRGDWSDRTYSCAGCRNRHEEATQREWEGADAERRKELHAAMSRHIKPDWSLDDYHAHVASFLAPLVEQARQEGAREFAHWVATNRAYNGSEYERGQSLYNECINAVLPNWAGEWSVERAATPGSGTARGGT